MTQSQFTSVRFLQLTDEDLRALGAVAAHWAIAEMTASDLLATLVGTDEGIRLNLPSEQIISFSSKAKNIKKLLRASCERFPKHLEVGLALISAGREIARERNLLTHWVASRSGSASSPTIQFANIQQPPARFSVEHSHWTTAELLDLADHIADWWSDLGRFRFSLICDGPLASRTVWHGSKPEHLALEPDIFCTIGKNRRSSGRGKHHRRVWRPR